MYFSRPKKALFVVTVIFVILLKFGFSGYAQHRSVGMNAEGNLLSGSRAGSGGGYLPTSGWGLSVHGGYENPIGSITEIYKGGPSFGLNVINRWNHLILSGTVDYRSFVPKNRVLPLEIKINGQLVADGEITLTNFTGLGVYLGAAYEFMITPGASFYAGVNLGAIRTDYNGTYSGTAEAETTEEPTKSTTPYVGPKLGLNFALGNKISLGVEAKYALGLGKLNFTSIDGTPDTQGFKSVAGNLFLTYSF
ncbi:hypothetical protein [Mucilaginibacter auburnensis]|uniref:Outer membrane protein with beta-barrel domain n=1 Tax=Mucilaginibacter auburnensis TaxID=1457233 RepID=A0A2H9VTH4_9SPHI|nr:hypothetical protein [Mucilaginibacter auburnensis]PJJ84126.1 hypothetical protein CLV57_1130 [Mucilaginibacter auburnensis]